MKFNVGSRLVFIFFILVLMNSLAFAQENFEGKIKFNISSDDEETMMEYFMKDGNIRMEMPGEEQGAMIFDGENMTILMNEQQMYMQFNYQQMQQKMGAIMDNEDNTEPEDIGQYKTGETKEILGHMCEKWLFEEEDSKVEAWVANDLGTFMMFKNPMGGSAGPGWSGMFEDNNFFPMLVITTDEDGEMESKYEVAEINESSLSSDLFSVPAGFKKMDIPGM